MGPRYRPINDLRHILGHQRNDTVLAIFPCHHPAPRIETITAANRRELNLVLFGSAVRMETDADPVGGEKDRILPHFPGPGRTSKNGQPLQTLGLRKIDLVAPAKQKSGYRRITIKESRSDSLKPNVTGENHKPGPKVKRGFGL